MVHFAAQNTYRDAERAVLALLASAPKGRTFPMMDDKITALPWALVQSVEARLMRNHSRQTVERLAQRGGLDVCELAAALKGLGWGEVRDRPFALAIIASHLKRALTTPAPTTSQPGTQPGLPGEVKQSPAKEQGQSE